MQFFHCDFVARLLSVDFHEFNVQSSSSPPLAVSTNFSLKFPQKFSAYFLRPKPTLFLPYLLFNSR